MLIRANRGPLVLLGLLTLLRHPSALAQPDEPALATHAPAAMTDAQLGDVAKFLALTEPQRLLFDQCAKTYRAAAQRVITESEQEIEFLSQNAARGIARGEYDAHSVRWLKSLRQAEQQVAGTLRDLDESFFLQISEVLAPFQAEAMPSVRARRQRAYADVLRRDLPAASIDLVPFLDSVQIHGVVDGPLDVVLREYDAEVTPVWLEHEVEIDRVDVRHAEISHRSQYDHDGNRVKQGTPRPAEMLERMLDEKHALLATRTRLLERLSEINRRYVDRVLLLAEDEAERARIDACYREATCSKVYPDMLDPCALVQADAIALADAAIRDALHVLMAEHARAWRALSGQMEREFTSWRLQFAGTLSSEGYPEHRQRMRDMRLERWELDVKTARQARDLIGQTEPGLKAALDGLLQQAEQAFARAESDDYPGIY